MHKLILHIGAGKCGSSAIQEYLRVNAAALRAQGVLVPTEDLTPASNVTGMQINLFHNLLSDPHALHACGQPTRHDAAAILIPRLAALRDEMERDNLHTLVLSAENLINEHAFSRLFAQAKVLFDVHVVAYIRRQDEHLSSAWGQWYVKRYASIDAYLAARVPVDNDWYEMLRAWREDFGADRIRVRLFDREFLHNGDVTDDFLMVTGLPADASHQKIGRINESNEESLIALANRVPDAFESMHDTGFFLILKSVLGNSYRPVKEKPWLFDFRRRMEIMAAYAESNERVRSTYFPEIPAGTPLFAPPREEDTLNLRPAEKLDRELSMLTRIVYALAARSVNAAAPVPSQTDIARNPETTQSLAALARPDSGALSKALRSSWYAERNPDVAKAGFDPVWHWRNYGAREGRLPASDTAQLVLELLQEHQTTAA